MALSVSQIERFRALLLERRERFALEGADELSSTVELDQSRVGRLSRLDAMQMQAMAQASDRRKRLEARRIDAALERLDGGEYGECFSCGEDIGGERLEVDPAATLCIDCATRSESPG